MVERERNTDLEKPGASSYASALFTIMTAYRSDSAAVQILKDAAVYDTFPSSNKVNICCNYHIVQIM